MADARAIAVQPAETVGKEKGAIAGPSTVPSEINSTLLCTSIHLESTYSIYTKA